MFKAEIYSSIKNIEKITAYLSIINKFIFIRTGKSC